MRATSFASFAVIGLRSLISTVGGGARGLGGLVAVRSMRSCSSSLHVRVERAHVPSSSTSSGSML